MSGIKTLCLIYLKTGPLIPIRDKIPPGLKHKSYIIVKYYDGIIYQMAIWVGVTQMMQVKKEPKCHIQWNTKTRQQHLNADNSTLDMVYRAFDASVAHMPPPA